MLVEPEIIKACIKKDRKAQYAMYRKCYGFMMGICLRYATDKDEAAALMNLGFLKVLTHMEKYKPEIPFELWMRKIIINTIIDDYRKNKKMKEMIEYREMHGNINETESVLNLAVRKMNLEQLNQFISKLPNVSRRVFNLYVVDGYTHEEISGMLDMSSGTSKWHLSTARQKLQDMILNFNESFKTKIA
ncbi:MAG: sigma-70 family RNA polymerase sigma factor [Bacteroidota bacterium]